MRCGRPDPARDGADPTAAVRLLGRPLPRLSATDRHHDHYGGCPFGGCHHRNCALVACATRSTEERL